MQRLYPVFASHSSVDKPFLSQLSTTLEERGIGVWEDKNVIRVGEVWKDPAEQGIKECQVFLLIMSPASLVSRPVQHEINLSRQYGKPIIPIMLERPPNWDTYTDLKDTTYADCRSWKQPGDVIPEDVLNRLIDGINAYRLIWFRELLNKIDPIDTEGKEKVEIIEDMVIRLGDRALPEFAKRIFIGVNALFQPPESTAVFFAVAKIGGEFAQGILQLALQSYHEFSDNMPAIIESLGHVGDLSTEMILNQRLAIYERLDPNPEFARLTRNAINRIRVRRMNIQRGLNSIPRDI